jgi:phenylacetate-CoA ligase
VPAAHYAIEVCDPNTGAPVAPGERGSLVISSFGLDAIVVRYDVEDIVVEHTGPCPCGQTGPRYTLLGRAADRADVGDRMVLPLDVQLALEAAGAPEFVLQPGRSDVLRVRVESDGQPASHYETVIRDAVGVAARVETVAVGSLPRSTFKPRRIATT